MNHHRYIDRLAQLVAAPSVSCTIPELDMSNDRVVQLLAQWFAELGFATRIDAIAGHPGKSNLIASKGQGPSGLILAGHTDTVPCNPDAWSQDPFVLTQKEGRLFGLGATDMKGFFPAVLEAMTRLKDVELKEPVVILATADEEASMCGARALATAGERFGRYAVVGEPTGMRPIRMHKGIMMESLKVTGLAGHSSNPALGKNALEVMNLFMTELLTLRDELQQKYRNAHFEVSVPTLNLGCIHGGDNPNRICQQCELHFDLRSLPGMTNDELRDIIARRLRPIAEAREVGMHFEPLFPGIDPFEQAADTHLVKLVEELTGHASQAAGFATEAPFFKGLGLETLIMGPGSIDQAHQPDEYIALDQLEPAVDIIERLIRRLCL